MPDDTLELLQVRLSRVEESLRAIEARLSLLDGRQAHATPVAPAVLSSKSRIDAALIGRSVLIVGGGYVLRALTELHLVGPLAGVALGILYALFWIWHADRAMTAGRRLVALFEAGTAAAISTALIWEATSRFRLIDVSVASALVVVVAAAICFVARRQQSTAISVMAAVMTTVACTGLAISTVDPVAPAIAVTIVGVLLSWVSIQAVTLIAAVASDMLALALAGITVFREPVQGVAIAEMALIGIAALWLLTNEYGQSVAAVIVGLGGAAVVAQVYGANVVPVAVACLAVGAAAFARALTRQQGRVLLIGGAAAVGIGTLLALPLSAVAIIWALAVMISAWSGMITFAACWALAAFVAACFSPQTLRPSLLAVVGICAAVALWRSAREARGARLMLIAVSTVTFIMVALAGIAGFVTDRAAVAIARTFILAGAAVSLSLLSRFVAEAKSIATMLLIIGGAKLLVEDLRVGGAASVVVALALYGGALLVVARRRVNVPSDDPPAPSA